MGWCAGSDGCAARRQRRWLGGLGEGAPRITLRLADGVRIGCVVARGFWRRLRGLIGTRPDSLGGGALVFARCASLHTFGMGYAIDVALVDRDGLVVRSERGVGPGRIVGAPGAVVAVERAAADGPWPVEGEKVVFEGGEAA